MTSPFRLSFAGSLIEERSITVPAQGFVDAAWSLPLESPQLFSGDFATVRVDVEGIEHALAFSLRGEPTWEGVRAALGNMTEIPIGDMKRWTKSGPAHCTMSMEKPLSDEQAVWRMYASFGEGDRWVYPRFEIPESIDLSTGDGIILWARCIGDAKPGFMLFDRGVSGYLVQPAIKSDGEWHVVKLPFEQFSYVSATPPDPNGKLDPDQVRVFSFGANPNGMNCVLELKRVALYSDKP
jgi:hypothetical protein